MRHCLPLSPLFRSERREIERFKLKLPAKVEVLKPGERQVFNLVTSSISAKAAYFRMLHPISGNRHVQVRIMFASDFVKKMTGFQMKLRVEGRVVRSEPTGMAIQFNEHQKVERICCGVEFLT